MLLGFLADVWQWASRDATQRQREIEQLLKYGLKVSGHEG